MSGKVSAQSILFSSSGRSPVITVNDLRKKPIPASHPRNSIRRRLKNIEKHFRIFFPLKQYVFRRVSQKSPYSAMLTYNVCFQPLRFRYCRGQTLLSETNSTHTSTDSFVVRCTRIR